MRSIEQNNAFELVGMVIKTIWESEFRIKDHFEILINENKGIGQLDQRFRIG